MTALGLIVACGLLALVYGVWAIWSVMQADPGSAQAWSARGVTYERLGDKAKAFTSYGRALALRPRDEAARSGLARTGG